MAEAYNKTFNLGSDQPHTVKQLAAEVARAFGVVPRVRHLEPRNEVDDAYSDHSKARRLLGAAAQMPLQRGLARTAAWVKQHGARRSREFDHIEVTRNLPRSWRRVRRK